MQAVVLATLMLMAAPPRGAAEPVTQLRALTEPGALDAPTQTERQAIESALKLRSAQLLRAGKLAPMSAGAATLIWPLRTVADFEGYGYHGTSGFVDHDPRYPDMREDYTCGGRTYDLATGYNHHGTDYYLWPYPWLMMDLELVQIVAAAPGVIVEKVDGNFDRACVIQGNSGFNAVFVRQDDGLTAWYLHMKRGTTTAKHVGDRVAAGDYLGLVGSSGPSSAPHLHFELHDGSDRVVDPYYGECNAAPDRWAVFQPYELPRIAALTTHSAEPELVDCGMEAGQAVHEEPHRQDHFSPGETLWAFAAYNDHRNGDVTRFSLLRADGSTFAEWDFDLASQALPRPFYSGTAWDWSYTLPLDAPPGTWTLQAEFAGELYRHEFQVEGASVRVPRGHSTHARPAHADAAADSR
jgi:murein DD-endopeptidase MepM/ murein hydrolase activator NlpD